MNAVILAGGAGRKDHFRPLAFPRPLLPLANRPLLEHQLAWLAEGGVQHAVVAVDHRGASLASPSLAGIDVRLSYAPVPMGADSGLLRAACGSADRLLVVDGSLLTDVDIPGLVAAHRRSGAPITVAAPQGGPGSACLLVAERSALDAIRAGRPDPVGRDVHLVVDPVACAGGRFPRRHQVGGYWREIRSPAEYVSAHLDTLAGRVASLPGDVIAPGVNAEGFVYVRSNATLGPPVLLGPGSVIEDDASVARSVLGARCTIAIGARVERSVILDGTHVGRGALVVDSIVGPSASLSDGAAVLDGSVVGPGARIASGQQLTCARVA